MAEHTPGPWFTGSSPNHASRVYARRPSEGARQVAVCDCEQHEWLPRSREENRANARLIAAAPDLLAACEELLRLWDNPDAWTGHEGDMPVIDVTIRGLVARAKGGSSC